MVTTRRRAAASPEQELTEAPVIKKTSRRKVTARTPSAARTAAPTITTTEATAVATSSKQTSVAASTTVTEIRRTRSKQTASPLKALDFEKASVAKTPVSKATPLKTKRKYGASHYTKASGRATAEPETATRASTHDESNDDQGMFFTQSMP
jgi:hypothetical protein